MKLLRYFLELLIVEDIFVRCTRENEGTAELALRPKVFVLEEVVVKYGIEGRSKKRICHIPRLPFFEQLDRMAENCSASFLFRAN